MRPNRLKQQWLAGSVTLNGWLHIPSTWSAEVMAHAGWDSVTVDMQHGLHSMETAIQMLQAISTTATVPLARVNWNEPGAIMRLLDGGAYGIICPMIEDRAACEAFVGACRYPPQGYRSLGPTRARLYAGDDYADHANDEILTIAMVETPHAVAQVDAIASVPGLDAVFVGSGDLRLFLQSESPDDVEARLDAALDVVLAACQRHNRAAGIFTTHPAQAQRMIARGFRFITISTDSALLQEAASGVVGALRSASST
jgi:4-hydroxy-2-oxoheptanedioate aldolase